MNTAILYYDYALTFSREVTHIWSRKPNLSTVLYLLCRHAMVGNVIFGLAAAGELKTMRVRKLFHILCTFRLFPF